MKQDILKQLKSSEELQQFMELFMNDPEQAVKSLETIISQFEPQINTLGSVLNNAIIKFGDLLLKSNINDISAKYKFQEFESLINQGFTEHQALKIITRSININLKF
jgi:hypothetical protein